MASRLGVDLATYRDFHEPWLERSGLTERTEKGRVATEKAREIYGAGVDAEAARRHEPTAPLGRQVVRILSPRFGP